MIRRPFTGASVRSMLSLDPSVASELSSLPQHPQIVIRSFSVPKIWKLISVEINDDEYKKLIELKSQFPPGVIDNVEPEFLRRAQWSTQVDGCVVLRYRSGREPDIHLPPFDGYATPTYKGLLPKRVSMIGKLGFDPGKGAVIIPTCGSKLCINQRHLEIQGRVNNQFSSAELPDINSEESDD